MIKLNFRKKKPLKNRPLKEAKLKSVPAVRFNAMIEYYTHELKSRLSEIVRLKKENELLIKTSVRNASRSDENTEEAKKLREEIRILQSRLRQG